MGRLTEKDDQGNWCIRGLPWKNLYPGIAITENTYERIYAVAKKLLDYEDTGLTPDQIRQMDALYTEKCREVAELRKAQGWIPVEREAPPTGERLQAKIKHHEWIADYDNDWVPEEERTRHPEYTEICEIVCVDGIWRYMCKEDGYELSEAYINPQKDVSVPIDEIIAWRPLSESYRPEAGHD